MSIWDHSFGSSASDPGGASPSDDIWGHSFGAGPEVDLSPGPENIEEYAGIAGKFGDGLLALGNKMAEFGMEDAGNALAQYGAELTGRRNDPEADAAVHRSVDPTLLEMVLTDPLSGGQAMIKRGLNAALADAGMRDPYVAGALDQKYSREFEATALPEKQQQAMQTIMESEDFGDFLANVATNPVPALNTLTQSLSMFAPSLIGMAILGPLGAAGRVGGAFTGSGSVEYVASFRDAITEMGGDPNMTGLEFAKALQDPELMERAREHAAKRGIAIGAFDALTAGIAGKILRGRTTLPGQVAGALGEVGVQMAGGAAGEASAQLWTEGEIRNPNEVYLEGLLEGPTAAIEVPIAIAGERTRQREGDLLNQALDGLQADEGAREDERTVLEDVAARVQAGLEPLREELDRAAATEPTDAAPQQGAANAAPAPEGVSAPEAPEGAQTAEEVGEGRAEADSAASPAVVTQGTFSRQLEEVESVIRDPEATPEEKAAAEQERAEIVEAHARWQDAQVERGGSEPVVVKGGAGVIRGLTQRLVGKLPGVRPRMRRVGEQEELTVPEERMDEVRVALLDQEDLDSPLDSVKVTVPYTIPETGDTVKIETNARGAYESTRTEYDRWDKLARCLR